MRKGSQTPYLILFPPLLNMALIHSQSSVGSAIVQGELMVVGSQEYFRKNLSECIFVLGSLGTLVQE